MQRCVELAAQAAAHGESPVGALLVRNGVVVAEAAEANRSKNDVTCHAEIEAIRQAVAGLRTNDLSDCVLYTTHEPCVMCAYVIRFHGIGKVVYRHAVPYLGSVSSSMALLRTAQVPPHWAKAPRVVQLEDVAE